MTTELLWGIAVASAPVVAVLVSLWGAARQNWRLRQVEQLGAIIASFDKAHGPDLREALIETQEDLVVSVLRRHRWAYGLGGFVTTIAWLTAGVVSTAVWQLLDFAESASVFMWVAVGGYAIGGGRLIRRWWVRVMYKDEGKRYLSDSTSSK